MPVSALLELMLLVDMTFRRNSQCTMQADGDHQMCSSTCVTASVLELSKAHLHVSHSPNSSSCEVIVMRRLIVCAGPVSQAH